LLGRRDKVRRLPFPLSMLAVGRWTEARDLPAPPRESFRAWWKRTRGGSS
jgi:L-lactate dehydrogenase complex protein LldF